MKRVTLALLACTVFVRGYSAGPPDGKTGRPGEGICLDCHSGSPGSADSSNLLGIGPGGYDPSSLHRLTLTVNYVGQRRWGFEMTVVDASSNPAGQLVLLDSTNTQFSSSGGYGYLKHTGAGTFPGQPAQATWQVGWRAPARGAGPVTFYWACNAANNDGWNTGDTIIRDSLVVSEASGIGSEPVGGRLVWRYPNPGRGRVVIEYSGKPDRPVEIWSATGRLVRTLQPVPAGRQLQVVWDGLDHSRNLVPEASYFIRLGDAVRSVVRVQMVR